MSRAGKNPITIPQGVEVNVSNNSIEIKSSKAVQSFNYDDRLATIEKKDGNVQVVPTGESKLHRTMWGTIARRLKNAIEGVDKGFEKRLELRGVGYRAQQTGNSLKLSLGFSNPVIVDLPAGIKATIEGDRATTLVISGDDKVRVGQIAGEIRSLRPPEPYKGKGVRYVGEFVPQKEGKKK